MKIIINATNIVEDRPLREVERLINLGKAHLPAQGGVIFNPNLLPLHNDGDVVLNSKQQEALKKLIEEKKIEDLPVITFEDLNDTAIFSEPDVTEIDLIEPIPIDHYVDFESPKKMSLLKKLKNKII